MTQPSRKGSNKIAEISKWPNSLTARYKMSDWIRKLDPATLCLQQFRLKVKGWEEYLPSIRSPKQATILSDIGKVQYQTNFL